MTTDRPPRDSILMMSAHLWSTRSTCSRLQVGAVFARDGRILVTGYNGAPAGLPHCDHDKNPGPCTTAEHAERNAIAWAARNGVKLEGSELFTTNMPCLACAMSIINAGVIRVVYDEPYRLTDGIELLRKAGIVVDTYHLVR